MSQLATNLAPTNLAPTLCDTPLGCYMNLVVLHLTHHRDSILQSLSLLPEDALVGVVTFGAMVWLHACNVHMSIGVNYNSMETFVY